jgi:hypothetical protein
MRSSRGVYLEYDDQICSGYNVIARCRVTRGCLEVDLLGPLGDLEGATRIDVGLDIDDLSYECLVRGLQQIFEGQARGKLTVD